MLQSGGSLSMLLREHAAATTFAIATHVYKPKEAAAHIRPELPTCISACCLPLSRAAAPTPLAPHCWHLAWASLRKHVMYIHASSHYIQYNNTPPLLAARSCWRWV